MIFPRTERIYEYKGTEYIVHVVDLFWRIIAQNILTEEDKHANSHFHTFNWWKFMWNAKFIKSNKLSSAY